MPPKLKQKFPDFLPYIRLAGPLGCSYPLSTANTQCAIRITPHMQKQVSQKCMIELRVLILMSYPPAEKKKPVPESITIKCAENLIELVNPKWTKVEGYWVNEEPVNISFMANLCPEKDSLNTIFNLSIEILDDPLVSGVAEVFVSRSVTAATLIKSVLATDPLPRGMIEERKLNMKESGIEYEIVSLKCPCLGTRIKTPVRFETCKHLECFDLNNFVKMEEKRPKGRCPVCNKLIEFRKLGVCEFTLQIIETDEKCQSFRLSPDGVENLSAASTSECRKRKRAALLSSAAINGSSSETYSTPLSPTSEAHGPVGRRRKLQPQEEDETECNEGQEKAKLENSNKFQQTLSEAPHYIVID